MKQTLIGISPGHGGEDSGACANGLTEASIARRIAAHLVVKLSSIPNVTVHPYGMNEKKKDYTARVKLSNVNGDNYYVPIHLNASRNTKAKGWLVLLDPNDTKTNPKLRTIATSILTSLNKLYPQGFADWDATKNGIMEGLDRPIYELTKPTAQTIYLELGFISNVEYATKLKDPVFIEAMATAIAQGLNIGINQ